MTLGLNVSFFNASAKLDGMFLYYTPFLQQAIIP